jgi:hypothetical protein
MFAILIVVSLTLHGHQHKFFYTSKAGFSQQSCEKRGDAMADRIARSVAGRVNASVKSSCSRLDTRPI